MEDTAKLEVKIVSRRIESKIDAFTFGLLETLGKLMGFGIALALLIAALKALGVTDAPS